MTRYQWIVWLGGGILGWVAGEMIVKDRIVHGWIEPWARVLHYGASGALFVALTLLGWWLARRSQGSVGEAVGTSEARE
jgi:predicted tellurium resistance membrane protein TerC